MRAAGLVLILPVLAACASLGDGPSVDPEIAEWSQPVLGLSCRARGPSHALRGELITVHFDVRVDPAAVPKGKTFLEGAGLEERTRLVLRDDVSGATFEVDGCDSFTIHDSDEVLRGVSPLSLGEEGTRTWALEFPLSEAWDSLVPGTWEARVVMESEPRGAPPPAWSGAISSAPFFFEIDEPGLRRLEVRVPRSIHLKADPKTPGGLLAETSLDDSDVVTIEARCGFLVGMEWRHGNGSVSGHGGEDVDGGAFTASVTPRPDGSIDEEHEVSIFEYGRGPFVLGGPGPGAGGYRVLWRRSYRVAFTAAEIEALRR